MLAFEPFEIAADHSHLTGDAAMHGTVERVSRAIAFASNTESTSSARFTANHRRHQKWQVARFEPADRGDSIEATVEQQCFYWWLKWLSPGDSNRSRNYTDKRQQCQDRGIPEYWIVDAAQQIVTVLILEQVAYSSIVFSGSDRIISPTFPDPVLTPAEIFAAAA